MKTVLISLIMLSCAGLISKAVAQTVKFSINIENQVKDGTFDPENDKVEIFGNIIPLRNSQALIMEPEEENSYIYVLEVEFKSFDVGQTLEYRFRLNTKRRMITEDNVLPRSLIIRSGKVVLGADFNFMWF
ncbi:MAG: hypothetical protein EA364_11505 [Balneolaceae bacterium]|jgi:hypothetical protein|nr:MAG: hypothetical protein EA364_11505 [Balneolaceae bacterium]